MLSLICDWLIGWVDNRQADDLRRHHAHYDVTAITGPFQYKTSVAEANPDTSRAKQKPLGAGNVHQLLSAMLPSYKYPWNTGCFQNDPHV